MERQFSAAGFDRAGKQGIYGTFSAFLECAQRNHDGPSTLRMCSRTQRRRYNGTYSTPASTACLPTGSSSIDNDALVLPGGQISLPACVKRIFHDRDCASYSHRTSPTFCDDGKPMYQGIRTGRDYVSEAQPAGGMSLPWRDRLSSADAVIRLRKKA